MVTAIGVTASNILWKLSNRPDVLPMTYDYYETILYAIEFGCDALSIAIFLFGKIQYTIVSTEEGRLPFLAPWRQYGPARLSVVSGGTKRYVWHAFCKKIAENTKHFDLL